MNHFERTIAVSGDSDDFIGLFSSSTLDLADTVLAQNLNVLPGCMVLQSEHMQFISPDSTGEMNAYAYTNDNLVDYVDPSGTKPEDIIFAGWDLYKLGSHLNVLRS